MDNLTFKQSTSENDDFKSLILKLDQYLADGNGDKNEFFAQFNKVDLIKNVVIAFEGNTAIGCGAFKAYDDDSVEIKRMYVLPEKRGNGIATAVLDHLEEWAASLGFSRCILETGNHMTDAIKLYSKNGYKKIPNYGQYEKVLESVCFEKLL
ncbi:GNAT family N-acetyltransferase [Marinigracilibium pacificum]|uniref:GNAT family N-acetyltransferase n=1 Tax=Marinigracilibium pacificum TaxID=2729599 RepID=A0A848IW31_9BACT|nr:GNAT family N-acetyltransferase [Marinigracilibium pacificum]NMM47451.1 GNAT family N-acetyltransferase [Marinigracilibium pacificum]